MFSRKYCEIFKSTYFEEPLWMAASYFIKKNRHSWRLNNSSKYFLNQWKSMGFQFCKLTCLQKKFKESACKSEISTRPARAYFTLRLHVEIKFHHGKAGQFSTCYLLRFAGTFFEFFCKHVSLRIENPLISIDLKNICLSCLVFSCVYSFLYNKKLSSARVLQNRCS